MEKQRIKELLFAINIVFILIMAIFIMIQVNSFYSGVEYNDDYLLLNVNPELKEGITFVYTDGIFRHSELLPNKNNLGLYVPYLNIIKIDVNETDLARNYMTKEQLLCHELCHHKWQKFMDRKEKKVWKDVYNNLTEGGKEYHQSADEMHSEWCEQNLEECFI